MIIVNPGSRIPADQPNTYSQALAEAHRWHQRMVDDGFGHDVDLVEPDPADCREGRWTFAFIHRVTGIAVELETPGLTDSATALWPPRQYWRGSSSASPELADWSAPGFVQTFRSEP